MKKMQYQIPDWEHDGDTDSARSELIKMGAQNLKVYKQRFDDPDYADDDEEAYEMIITFECKDKDVKKFIEYGCY